MRAGLAALVVGSIAINAACLDRPVVPMCSGYAGLSISKVRATRVDKVDLLIVVDNSISMADKQSELGRRMPELIAALTDPTPDPMTGRPSNVMDVHVGVITSSLGSHGTSACAVEMWIKIQGPIGQRDPQMIESIKPRDGVPGFAGDRTVNYNEAEGGNGGDRDITDGDDLQYACIEERSAPGSNNDCEGTAPETKNPLCAAGNTQAFFKAYPGLRHLRIARDLGISGFVSSICAKSYKPAIQGITNKLKAAINAQCLRTSVSPDANGNVDCLIVEALKDTEGGRRCEDVAKGLCTPGAAPCRREGSGYRPISPDKAAAQLNLPIVVIQADGTAQSTQTQAVAENGNVYVVGDDKPTPRKHLVCEIAQFSGNEQKACITDATFKVDPATSGGWCYSSGENLQNVAPQCIKLGAPGTIRFVGGAEPRNGSEVFTYCGNGGGC